ncbi:MAG: ribose-phosphate pyrophosphokinase [Nitrososphaerota archaeon]|nr:ribose-phosphate pyrophosphokinase [Nitrososphaerota archaeon]MDG7023647.1 ribose-phosphate pyrophosphokinase [Nitrososphaerota archaeon]
MAEKLVLAGPASEELGRSVAERLGLSLLGAEFKVFPDGESKFTLNEKVSGKSVLLIQSTHAPVDQHLFQLLLAAHQLSEEGAKVTAVVPYLAYARQDKEFLPGEGVTLGVIAHLMRSMGVRRLVTVDIHSAEGLALFSFPTYSVSAIPSLVNYVKEKLDLKDPVVISPDFGGSKRTEAFAQLYGAKFLQLSKTRDRTTGDVSVQEPKFEVEGKEVVIVDDIISTGGTVRAAAEAVLKQGARKALAVCVHGLFVGDAVQKLEDAPVGPIVCTNTVPGKYSRVDVAAALASHLRTLEE